MKDEVPKALSLSGDGRIEKILENAVVIPAFACRLDGFMNDTVTEYANASVIRPPSVCRAGLVSELGDVIHRRGRYYLGFTMYAAAGADEAVDIWIGHRCVARTALSDPDNRLHLLLAPEKFAFKGGEPIRLVTNATSGPCRIENVVLFDRKPRGAADRLKIASPSVDVRIDGERPIAYVTWRSNRPASGRLRWGLKGGKKKTVLLRTALSNHEVVLENLAAGDYVYDVDLADRSRRLEAQYSGAFRVRPSRKHSEIEKGRFALEVAQSCERAWPVTVGVPFKKGAVSNIGSIRVVDSSNRPVPTQVAAQSRWDDGSIQWALLDYEGDGVSDCAVEFGKSVRNETDGKVRVRSSRRHVEVVTGPLRVRIPRDRTVIPGLVEVRQDGSSRSMGDATAVTAVDAVGRAYRSGAPDSLTVETSGPQRATIRLEVTHRSRGSRVCLRSVFRLHFFSGSRRVRVEHTVVNDVSDLDFERVQSLSLCIPVEVGNAPVLQSKGRHSRAACARIEQLDDNRFDSYEASGARRRAQRVAGGRRSNGAASVTGDRGSVSVAIRDFWQNYPKALTLAANSIVVEVLPSLDSSRYPRGGELEDRLYYYLLDGHYKLRKGISRTSEFWISYGQDEAADLADAVASPPIYRAPLSHFNDSDAWTRFPPKNPSPYPEYEEWVAAARDAYEEDRQTTRAYGMLNFGDWFGERKYNWGNMEYDTPWCFLQEFIRGGDVSFFRWADEAASHLVDVDTCHADGGPIPKDAQYLHCVGHVGGYYPDGYRESAMFSGLTMPSHTWVEGPFLHSLLTGDRRIRDSAIAVSETLIGDMVNDYDFTNCRECGWHLIHLSAAYRATGRRVFLNAGRIIVDRVLERQRSSGGWDRLMVPGHCFCDPPRHTGNAGFMVGVLMVGLKRFHEATGDARVTGAIIRAADYCIETMWVPESCSFRYTCCPKSIVDGAADMRILKGVAAAYQFTGEERFKRILLAGVETAIGGTRMRPHRGVGKSICSPMRGALQVIASLPDETSTKRVEAR